MSLAIPLPVSAGEKPLPTDLWRMTATQLVALTTSGDVSAREVVDAHLQRIEVVNPECNAFTVVMDDLAREQARDADNAQVRGQPLGPLHGIPVAIKDITPTRGILTTRGCVAFANWIPDEDAPVVERLKSAGAIIIGKTATAELAHSSFTRSQLWGITRNPHRLDKTPGGSSGGAAAAVASGCVPLAEGTDSGGSIRIPASCCGIVGLKPSRGRVPAHSSMNDFDLLLHHGPLARSVADAALFLAATQGPDDRDPFSLPSTGLPTGLGPNLSSVKIAVSVDLGHCAVHPRIASNLRQSAEILAMHGAQVDEINLGWPSEVSTVWVTYWATSLATEYGDVIDGLGDQTEPALRRLVALGRRTSAIEFKRIELVQTQAWQRLRDVLANYDVLMCPTLAIPVPDAEGFDDDDWGDIDAGGRLTAFDMTAAFNLLGFCPVISLPNGVDDEGMPTGIQLVGHRHADDRLLKLAAVIEPFLARN